LILELSGIRGDSIVFRERAASSTAPSDGLSNRRIDLLERIENELILAEKDVFEFSNLADQSDLPDALTPEELLDEKKRERDQLGSVNLRADEETSKYEIEIKKMEKDRSDLVTALVPLHDSINALPQKGRAKKLEAFEKVTWKFTRRTQNYLTGKRKLE
jgi:Chromosome segregation ATPases